MIFFFYAVGRVADLCARLSRCHGTRTKASLHACGIERETRKNKVFTRNSNTQYGTVKVKQVRHPYGGDTQRRYPGLETDPDNGLEGSFLPLTPPLLLGKIEGGRGQSSRHPA
jgi:hypothetical protein